MRKFTLSVALAGSLALSACATTPNTRVNEARGLATAWASLDAVAVTLDQLALSHTLKGPKALQAADGLEKARQALTAADAAYRAGNTGTAEANVAAATSLISTLVVIASTKGGQ